MKLILADDHEIFRLGIKAVIEADDTYIITGEASDGAELLSLMESTDFDLVIIDLSMPNIDGFAILDEIAMRYPTKKRLVLSMHNDQESIKKALAKKIDGYINKKDIAKNIIIALQSIQNGDKYFSKDIEDIILNHYNEIFTQEKEIKGLTRREKEIAQMIASGMTNKKIATSLHISVNTVQFHRSNIMKKMDLSNTADIVKFVIQNDL